MKYVVCFFTVTYIFAKKYICDVKLWLTLIPIGYGHFIRCSFLTQSRKLNFVMRWINLIRHYAWSIHLTNPQFIYILKAKIIQDVTILRIKHRTIFRSFDNIGFINNLIHYNLATLIIRSPIILTFFAIKLTMIKDEIKFRCDMAL